MAQQRTQQLNDQQEPCDTARYVIFLGGHDLEMQTIGQLAQAAGVPVCDRGLAWGAKASDYRTELAAARHTGHTPVLVELPWDLDESADQVVLVDHHNEQAGADAPSALRQVHRLLNLPAKTWTRQFDLIEANDIGWIPAMQALGATAEEIRAIRTADRAAQGVSETEEQQAAAAVTGLRWSDNGLLAIVHSPHDRSAPITDRLHPALNGDAVDNLLILGPAEAQFFGRGDIIQALARRYPPSWYGGALPERGYWGCARSAIDADLAQDISDWLSSGVPSTP